jgi:uncharacterized membrane protein YeaQ/YmgE (transglycosylase-associated protein family)
MEILWFIIVGIVAGWLASVIMRGRGFGLIGDLVLGIVGAVIGGFIFRLLGIDAYGTMGTLAMSVLGAIVVLGIAGVLRKA